MSGSYQHPEIKIYVNGTLVEDPLKQHLTSIEVSESLDQIDILEARFTVPSSGKMRSSVLKLAKHGQKMKVEMCSNDSPKRTLEGKIVEIGYHGAGNRGLELVLRGLSDLALLKSTGLALVHEGDDAAVIKAITSKAGLSAQAQGVDGAAEFQFQPNTTNAEYMADIAKRNNYVVRIDDGKLVFGRSTKMDDGVKIKLKWAQVIDVSLNQSLDGIVTKVTVSGKDLKANKFLLGKAAATDVAKISGGDSGTDLAKKAFGEVEHFIDHTDDADQSQLTAIAKGEIQRRAERFVQGEMTVQFQAEARSGAKLTIEDPLHWPLAGPFIVREVTQLWDTADGARSRISFFSDSLPTES